MTQAPASAAPVIGRLPGLDLARFLAVAGMVLVHARDVLASDAASAVAPWLEVIQAVATNRARLLFFLLAGVGVALLARRQAVGAGVLLRRALFLTVLGVGLALGGWGDLILVFYGALFALAVVLMKLGDRVLLVVAAIVASSGVMLLAANPSADDTLTNVLLLIGEMVPMLSIGLVIGRAELTNSSAVTAIGRAGALLAVPGLAYLAITGGLDITEVEGRIEPAAALFSTAGLSVLLLAVCLRLLSGGAGRWAPMVAAGGMPLSAYVGHALLFTLVADLTDFGLGASTAVALGYLAMLVLVAIPWRRRHGSGPVETLMRRVSRPRQPGVRSRRQQ